MPRTIVRSCVNSAICWNIRESDDTSSTERVKIRFGADDQQGRSIYINVAAANVFAAMDPLRDYMPNPSISAEM